MSANSAAKPSGSMPAPSGSSGFTKVFKLL